MNQDVAKQIGAFPHKDLKKHTKPGSIIVDCSTGSVTIMPSGKEFDKFCEKYAFRGTYYKVVPETDKAFIKEAKEANAIEAKIDQLQKELRELEELSKKQRGNVQKKMLAGSKSHVVLFFHVKDFQVKEKKKIDIKKIKLRPGDKLVNFGCRYKQRGAGDELWIGIVEVQGVASESVKSFYSRYRFDNDINKPSYCRSIKTTGYKVGDEFIEGCSLVLVNHGKLLKKPLTSKE